MTVLEPIQRLERDIKRASATLGRNEARFLVDTYYSIQDFRMASANQVRSILKSETAEPHSTLQFFFEQFATMEKQIQSSLDTYSASDPWGIWLRSHTGVGPVIAAGLMAHIDISKAPYASSVWRFAGLLPGQKKTKGVKRDWNADLKVLAWKLGDSFVKQSGRETCYYGHLYRQRKELEVIRDKNVRDITREFHQEWRPDTGPWGDETAYRIGRRWLVGGNAEAAFKTLKEKNITDPATKKIYESGHLPDGRLDMRARRYAVKRFLAHAFEQLWWYTYGTEPPKPWIVEHGGHPPEHVQPNPFVAFEKRKVY